MQGDLNYMTSMRARTIGACSCSYRAVLLTPNNVSPAAFTVARFDPTGRYVFVGTSNGSILVFHSRTKTVRGDYSWTLHLLILV